MKHLLYINCIFLFLTITSCQADSDKKVKQIDALKYSDPLKVNKIYDLKNDTDTLNPFKILNVNDKYIIVSELNQNNFFHIFSLPDITFLYSSGKKGNGPTEFVIPPMNLNVKRDVLEIYDPIVQRVRFFSVTDTSLIESGNIPLRFKGQIEPLNRVTSINDSTYFADYGTSVEKTNSEYIALRPTEEDSLFTLVDIQLQN